MKLRSSPRLTSVRVCSTARPVQVSARTGPRPRQGHRLAPSTLQFPGLVLLRIWEENASPRAQQTSRQQPRSPRSTTDQASSRTLPCRFRATGPSTDLLGAHCHQDLVQLLLRLPCLAPLPFAAAQRSCHLGNRQLPGLLPPILRNTPPRSDGAPAPITPTAALSLAGHQRDLARSGGTEDILISVTAILRQPVPPPLPGARFRLPQSSKSPSLWAPVLQALSDRVCC
ncbi:hypothetical protein NDU88_002486 [Pleurodeles waltl]|uniref:Uncharacterized protein n=1 Tax=Pleurodeles waltl TaxID=8319 RepID=A0AAV7SAM3_PLEWA|nr:hypothetical protein NDU88_002486 [Pleurodeles waltl]